MKWKLAGEINLRNYVRFRIRKTYMSINAAYYLYKFDYKPACSV